MTSYALHQAVTNGDLNGISALLSGSHPEIDINAADRKGWTPLMYAVTNPKAGLDLLRTLLQHGARTDQGEVLTTALNAGDPKKIAVLIEAGADIRCQREHGYDALVYAVHGRDVLHDPHLIELLNLLIANGVSLTGMTSYEESGVRALSVLGGSMPSNFCSKPELTQTTLNTPSLLRQLLSERLRMLKP